MMSDSRELALLSRASQMLAEATSLDEVMVIRDKAEAARSYAKSARLGLALQNRAAELKLRAERKAGALLSDLDLRGGDRRSNGHSDRLNLGDLEISQNQSKRWQRAASVPEQDFKRYLDGKMKLGEEITAAGLLRLASGLSSNGKSRRARPRNENCNEEHSQQVRTANGPHELIAELRNHRELLAEVLRPVYQGADGEFQRGERRVVGHLLREIEGVLDDLEENLRRSPVC